MAHEANVNRVARKISNAIERYRLDDKQFVIVSNNCWGYELYQGLGREYNTPFVGLFLFPDCYIRFLENFDECMNSAMKFSSTSKYFPNSPGYPVGVLCGDIEIHFLHYKSQEEALNKWTRRTSRIKKAKERGVPFFVKFCDRDGCLSIHIEKFHALKFSNKISFGINNHDIPNHLYLPHLKDLHANSVIDGLKLYQKRYDYFDISDWISNGIVRNSFTSQMLSFVS